VAAVAAVVIAIAGKGVPQGADIIVPRGYE
jgi:hypothetical protein